MLHWSQASQLLTLFEGGLRRLTMFATSFNLQVPVRMYETHEKFGLAALASIKTMI